MIPAAILLAATMAVGFDSFGGTGQGGHQGAPRLPLVAWYGDSRTAGACSGTAPPAALDALLPTGYVVANKGVSGETAHQIYARVHSGAATDCRGAPCGHYVVQGGVNTLKGPAYAESAAEDVAVVALHGSNSDASAECSTEEEDDCGTMDSVDLLHSTQARARIVVFGEMPYAGCDNATCPGLVAPGPRATAYNARLQAECATRPWLTCLLPYEEMEDPENADHLLPAYACSDGIHLVNAGSAFLAQKVFNVGGW